MFSSVFKILRQAEWQELGSTGMFLGSPDDQRDGFIHLSTHEQVPGTLDKHFGAEANLVIIELSSAALDSMRFETSRGGARFPHLYRPLRMSDVVRTYTLEEFAQAAHKQPSLTPVE